MDEMLWICLLCGGKMKELDDVIASLPKRFRVPIANAIEQQLQIPNGNRAQWEELLSSLPNVTPSSLSLSSDTIVVGDSKDISDIEFTTLYDQLQHFKPWRKGPFSIFGHH